MHGTCVAVPLVLPVRRALDGHTSFLPQTPPSRFFPSSFSRRHIIGRLQCNRMILQRFAYFEALHRDCPLFMHLPSPVKLANVPGM
jgi:hypothetical protein